MGVKFHIHSKPVKYYSVTSKIARTAGYAILPYCTLCPTMLRTGSRTLTLYLLINFAYSTNSKQLLMQQMYKKIPPTK